SQLSQLSDPKNVIAALIVRDVNDNKYSLVSPEVLGNSPYTLPYINWTATSKPKTTFYSGLTPPEYSQASDSTSIEQRVQAQSVSQNLTKFSGNADGVRALIGGNPVNPTSGPHNYLAFQQQYPPSNPTSKFWGLIKVNSTVSSTATLEVKLIRK
ncbi:MAG: hypothetical protein NZZ60_05930, partial [Bacteroidia bacterium]|nr:hypothetical protein [Bacteroidia bacterium]